MAEASEMARCSSWTNCQRYGNPDLACATRDEREVAPIELTDRCPATEWQTWTNVPECSLGRMPRSRRYSNPSVREAILRLCRLLACHLA